MIKHHDWCEVKADVGESPGVQSIFRASLDRSAEHITMVEMILMDGRAFVGQPPERRSHLKLFTARCCLSCASAFAHAEIHRHWGKTI